MVAIFLHVKNFPKKGVCSPPESRLLLICLSKKKRAVKVGPRNFTVHAHTGGVILEMGRVVLELHIQRVTLHCHR